MANDFIQTQEAGGGLYERARAPSLQQRALGPVPGYHMVKRLGQGAYGEAWLVTKQNNPTYREAVKFYTRHGGDWSSLAREVEKLNILTTDPYFVQLLDVGDAKPRGRSVSSSQDAGPRRTNCCTKSRLKTRQHLSDYLHRPAQPRSRPRLEWGSYSVR
jgi:hypothetical protein